MSDRQPEAPDNTPYLKTLMRAAFPHIWLNEGRGLLQWRWVRFTDRRKHALWLYTYRFEVSMEWLSLLLILFWAVVHLKGVFDLGSALFEAAAGFWLLYGLVLMRAMRWAAPDLPEPKTRRKRRGSK